MGLVLVGWRLVLVLGHNYPSHWFCLHVMNNRHKVLASGSVVKFLALESVAE